MFKKKFEHLVLLGVLEIANDSEWGAPYFTLVHEFSWKKFVHTYVILYFYVDHCINSAACKFVSQKGYLKWIPS